MTAFKETDLANIVEVPMVPSTVSLNIPSLDNSPESLVILNVHQQSLKCSCPWIFAECKISTYLSSADPEPFLAPICVFLST